MARLNISKAREDFSNILNRVAYGGERIVLNRRGKDLAALVPIEDLVLLQELENRQDAEAARKALATPERIPHEEVRRQLGR